MVLYYFERYEVWSITHKLQSVLITTKVTHVIDTITSMLNK